MAMFGLAIHDLRETLRVGELCRRKQGTVSCMVGERDAPVFFDTLVPNNDENRRRARFWLEYAKKQGKVKDFQVAVSDDDIYRIRASRAKTIPSYSRVTGGKTSAFLMVFEGYGTEYVIIEFSETWQCCLHICKNGIRVWQDKASL